MGACFSQTNEINNEINLDKLNDSVELFSLEKLEIKAKIVKVYDGDTCYAVFILDNKPVKFKIRMNGYDSPEIKPLLSHPNRDKEIEAAKIAKSKLEELVLNKIVILECGKWDKYGRLLGTLYTLNTLNTLNKNKKDINVNDYMIKNNYGYSYDGGTKKEVNY
jgi:endonuclease YncB( thermonuclease family)